MNVSFLTSFRFRISLGIRALADSINERYGLPGQRTMLFPSHSIAQQCVDFLKRNGNSIDEKIGKFKTDQNVPRILDLALWSEACNTGDITTKISVVLFTEQLFPVASKFWQHTGEGVSSRRAQFFQHAFAEGRVSLYPDNASSQTDKKVSTRIPTFSSERDLTKLSEEQSSCSFDESIAQSAKSAIKSRLAGKLTAYMSPAEALKHPERREDNRGVSKDDVILYPTGMSAIHNIHRTLIKARGALQSVMFGKVHHSLCKGLANEFRFPYCDTLKILQCFGSGCLFYGHGSTAELDDLEKRCKSGEKFLALFCEFPGNPLLKTPHLRRISELADRFDFAIVIDDTIGNFLNVNVLPSADAVVCSLTKAFSGACNVMGGR